MEKVQYNLFRDDKTEIPNIYFDIENSYLSNNLLTNELNPNTIKHICKNDMFSNTEGLDAEYNNQDNDSEYNNYINNNKYNNFIYKYITNQDTSLNNIEDKTQKDQLQYLTCELLKIKNKKFDTNNFILNNNSSFLNDDSISIGLIIVSVIIVIYILIYFIIKISKENDLFFKKFKKFNGIVSHDEPKFKKLAYFFLYLCIITLILVAIFEYFNRNSQNLSNNKDTSSILFYDEQVEDDNYKSVIDGTKIYFILSFLLIFTLYSILQIFIPISNFDKANIGIYICSFIILVITICTVLSVNIYENQVNLTTDNLYNTGKNIYQNIINGIKENFGYIILLLFLSIISYISVLFIPDSFRSRPLFKFLIILFSSFGYFLPLFIIFFEFSFAILYSSYFILSIILFRVVFYMISYILKVINKNTNFSIEFLSVLFEYPKEYFEKLFSKSTIAANDFPKNNPSGMPWNLTSINIIKLLVFIARKIFHRTGPIVDYFTRTLNP